jgi:hypothetical protein
MDRAGSVVKSCQKVVRRQETRIDQEWDWSVETMREAVKSARESGDLVNAVEPVHRFESHFLNSAGNTGEQLAIEGKRNFERIASQISV